MELTKIKGIMNDLVNELERERSNVTSERHTNILKQKDDFDKFCFEFFKERLPKDFDFSRFKKIDVSITGGYVKIFLIVDDQELSCCLE